MIRKLFLIGLMLPLTAFAALPPHHTTLSHKMEVREISDEVFIFWGVRIKNSRKTSVLFGNRVNKSLFLFVNKNGILSENEKVSS